MLPTLLEWHQRVASRPEPIVRRALLREQLLIDEPITHRNPCIVQGV